MLAELDNWFSIKAMKIVVPIILLSTSKMNLPVLGCVDYFAVIKKYDF
jgi:hypothetical protein